jgi:membrane protease YdiL (CAAX protease family)
MSPPGSESPRPLPALLAFAATVLGALAMSGGALLVSRLGLGLSIRAQITLGTVLLAVPALLALAVRPPAWRAALGSSAVPRQTAALSILLGAALWVGSIGLMETQSLVAPPPPEYLAVFRAIHRALTPVGPLDLFVSLAVIAALPGLCEELVVRGVLLPSLVRPLGLLGAVLASAFLFAAMHLDAYRFLFTFTVGFVLGVLRLRTLSLVPPILAHITLNALTFAIAPLIDDPSQPYTPQPALGLACLVVGAAATWPLLRALRTGTPPPA